MWTDILAGQLHFLVQRVGLLENDCDVPVRPESKQTEWGKLGWGLWAWGTPGSLSHTGN